MTKPILKLGFTDTFGAISNFFVNILSEDFEIVRDDVNPDYLIFGDKNFGNQNVNFNEKKCIKIFYTGENERPWNYACHYAITFDHIDDDRHYRLPLYVIYDYDNQYRNVVNSKTVNREPSDLNKKFSDKFCSFVVKNGACEKRNYFFQSLSEYKKVDSGGPLFNNIGYIIPRGEESVAAKMKFLNDYKFNLCFENSSYPGYATEKLYEAYMGGTVPIYWGSTTIECDFNPKAFLNWHDYHDDLAFFDAIIEMDQKPELYEQMYLEPLFNNWKEPYNKYMDMDRFRNWFKKNVYKGEINR
jgi:alpha(1,3/1,4) fucosyltransferase